MARRFPVARERDYLDVIAASRVKARPIEWLVEPFIPRGAISVVGGRPGIGKSLMTAWLAAEVSQEAGPVILSSQEDAVETVLQPRLQAAGARLDRVYIWNDTESPIVLPDDADRIEERVEQLGAVLLILDPVAGHFRRDHEVDQRTKMMPLKRLAERTGCAIVCIHHVRKQWSQSSHILEVFGGRGGGLIAASRAAYLFAPNPKDTNERIMARAKGNWDETNPDATPALTFEVDVADVKVGRKRGKMATLLPLERVTIDIHEVAAVAGAGRKDEQPKHEKRAACAEWLTAYLAVGPKPAKWLKEDAAQAGHTWATVRRAADKIDVVKQRHGFGKGSEILWRLPDGHPALKEGPDVDHA